MALRPDFATRLNSFAADRGVGGRPTPLELIRRAGTVEGLTSVDLNFPDHFAGSTLAEVRACVADAGLGINGLAMRYYGDADFKRGALGHPDAAIRQKAVELTLRGVDATAEAGADLLTVWLGEDGFDYPFQADYADLWKTVADGLRRVALHNPDVRIAIEYKPDEPRARALLGDIGTTLLMIREIGCANVGVCLDFAHVLYAGEQPAFAAAMAAHHARLYGLHLNDAYGARDDGMMVGSVHGLQTLELLFTMDRVGYDGAIYFDTFPDASGLDPVEECRTNIMVTKRLLEMVETLRGRNDLAEALARQDTIAGQRIAQGVLLGIAGGAGA
ncbi:MAG: sugar phosphate isomerase/epimerase family protein [Alphaproteobacteria bacterium]